MILAFRLFSVLQRKLYYKRIKVIRGLNDDVIILKYIVMGLLEDDDLKQNHDSYCNNEYTLNSDTYITLQV